jgi:hypothetical protein
MISVYATNACGDSPQRDKNISTSTSTIPGSILGERYGLCSLVVNFNVAPVAGVTSYNWTLPPGSVLISGQGTNSISFTLPPAFVSGEICVNSSNGCASSATRCATIFGAPIRPATITGDNFACATDIKAYSVPPSYGATSYNWTVPPGSTVSSGQGTPSASVTFGATSGYVRSVASNACGNRGAVAYFVTISCRQGLFNDNFDVAVNPNPASESAYITLSGIAEAKVIVTITNVIGKDILKHTVNFVENETIPLDLSGYSKGIYLVTVQSGDYRKVTRLIVQ